MNKPEPIYLTESDAIDAFAPEAGSEPRRTARESSGEPLEAFQSEGFAKPDVFDVFEKGDVYPKSGPDIFAKSDVFDVFEKSDAFAGSKRASVPLRTRRRVHPVSLVAVAGIAAIFAVVVMQQSNAPESMPTAPIASSTVGGSEATPVLPPVTAAPPSPSPSVPEPTVDPSQQTAAIAETPPPIAAQPAPPPADPNRLPDPKRWLNPNRRPRSARLRLSLHVCRVHSRKIPRGWLLVSQHRRAHERGECAPGASGDNSGKRLVAAGRDPCSNAPCVGLCLACIVSISAVGYDDTISVTARGDSTNYRGNDIGTSARDRSRGASGFSCCRASRCRCGHRYQYGRNSERACAVSTSVQFAQCERRSRSMADRQ